MKFKFTKKQIPFYISFLGAVVFAVLYFMNTGYVSYDEYLGCNVQGIDLYGEIYTYVPESDLSDEEYAYEDEGSDYGKVSSEDVLYTIKDANEDPNTKAIFINVDSPGGSPVAGEEISIAIKNSEKPVIALVRGIGASSAYWAISSADKIFASRNSDVGSIGVTMSYINEVELNKKEGYKFEELASGKFKDSGSVDKVLTQVERDLFMRDINIMHENFVEDIALNRNLDIEKVKAFADGSTVLGARAKELGLIDEIGSIYDVEKYLESTLAEPPQICW